VQKEPFDGLTLLDRAHDLGDVRERDMTIKVAIRLHSDDATLRAEIEATARTGSGLNRR
jgi:hypothetical protein